MTFTVRIVSEPTPGTGNPVRRMIPDYRVEELEERISKVNKHAAKLGARSVTLRLTGAEEMRTTKETYNWVLGKAIAHKIRFVEVEVAGEVPRLPGGWELLGVVNHEEGLPIVKCVPGRELPAGQRDRGNLCDHCQTRRGRKDTFVLRAEDGRVVQVGRTCIAEFLGSLAHRPEYILELLAFLRDPTAELGDPEDSDELAPDSFRRGRLKIVVEYVVLLSAACIDEEGWMSRKQSRMGDETATADVVAWVLWPGELDCKSRERMERIKARVTDALHAEVEAALAWARTYLGAQDDYLNNLATLASMEAVGADKLGILVSLVAAYRREQDRLRLRERQARTSAHVGAVGERLILTLTLKAPPKVFDGDYGMSYRCDLEDADGHTFTWWASSDPSHGGHESGWVPGTTRSVKATVKKHEEFRGVKTTVLTRVSQVPPKEAKT